METNIKEWKQVLKDWPVVLLCPGEKRPLHSPRQDGVLPAVTYFKSKILDPRIGVGIEITNDVVGIDVDDKTHGRILLKIFQDMQLKFLGVETTHGYHFYFKKRYRFKTYKGLCILGFPIELYVDTTRHFVAKINGGWRQIVNKCPIANVDKVPKFLIHNNHDCFEIDPDAHRNNQLMQLYSKCKLDRKVKDWEYFQAIVNLINQYVFKEPLPTEEIEHTIFHNRKKQAFEEWKKQAPNTTVYRDFETEPKNEFEEKVLWFQKNGKVKVVNSGGGGLQIHPMYLCDLFIDTHYNKDYVYDNGVLVTLQNGPHIETDPQHFFKELLLQLIKKYTLDRIPTNLFKDTIKEIIDTSRYMGSGNRNHREPIYLHYNKADGYQAIKVVEIEGVDKIIIEPYDHKKHFIIAIYNQSFIKNQITNAEKNLFKKTAAKLKQRTRLGYLNNCIMSCLLPTKVDKSIYLFHGKVSVGKTFFVNLFERFVPLTATKAERNRFKNADIKGKMLLVYEDIEMDNVNVVKEIKSDIGWDKQLVEQKYKDSIIVINYATRIGTTNDRTRIKFRIDNLVKVKVIDFIKPNEKNKITIEEWDNYVRVLFYNVFYHQNNLFQSFREDTIQIYLINQIYQNNQIIVNNFFDYLSRPYKETANWHIIEWFSEEYGKTFGRNYERGMVTAFEHSLQFEDDEDYPLIFYLWLSMVTFSKEQQKVDLFCLKTYPGLEKSEFYQSINEKGAAAEKQYWIEQAIIALNMFDKNPSLNKKKIKAARRWIYREQKNV